MRQRPSTDGNWADWRGGKPETRTFLLPALFALFLWLPAPAAPAEQRFPPPDFVETNHRLPVTSVAPARALALQYLDVAVLAAALGAAVWLVYRKRSRGGLVALSLFSVLYFGFWRKGCVCAIGSIQNVALALAGAGYAAPVAVTAFFVLPLAVALFAGRTFCAGVCPHGALQDLFLLKPVKLPAWLEHGLSILPFVYLGAGILFAATGSAFIICEYDPFISIFRLTGRFLIVGAGVALLLLGMFVGRPYCRFLCPYGALLNLTASVGKWRVQVLTADECIRCRLCEACCPYGAIRGPDLNPPAPAIVARKRRRLAWAVALLPLLLGAGVWLGARFSAPASRLHPTVHLAERLVRERDTPPHPGAPTPADLELEHARQAPKELLASAVATQRVFSIATPVFGAWLGLVIGLKLIGLAARRPRTQYEPEPGACLACARCFEHCPK